MSIWIFRIRQINSLTQSTLFVDRAWLIRRCTPCCPSGPRHRNEVEWSQPSMLVYTPFHWRLFEDRSFTYALPYLWNQLPSSFRQPHSVHSPPDSPHPAHMPRTTWPACVRVLSLSKLGLVFAPQLPTTDTVTVGRRGFYYAGPAIWNSLPPHMTDMSMSLFCSRKLSKTFLFHWHYTVNCNFW